MESLLATTKTLQMTFFDILLWNVSKLQFIVMQFSLICILSQVMTIKATLDVKLNDAFSKRKSSVF